MGKEARAPQGASGEWLGILQTLAEQIQKEQQTSQKMVQEMMNTYMKLLNTPGTYLAGRADQQHQTVQQSAQQLTEQVHQQQQAFQQQAQQQQKAFQEMTQEVLNTYTQLFNTPLSYAQEGLRSARFPIEGYEELSVEEVSGRLGGLSPEELRMVRDYEERTKRRDTLLEQLDSKIRGGFYAGHPRGDAEGREVVGPGHRGGLPRTRLPKLFGNSHPRANLLTIRRIIAAYTNASALAHNLS